MPKNTAPKQSENKREDKSLRGQILEKKAFYFLDYKCDVNPVDLFTNLFFCLQ